jgi:tRNA nucleotidyltransferase/poly(A) polymerase
MKQAARRIVEKLRLHGHEAFFAGGWVRDYLLRRKPKDIDIATSALPDEVIQLFPKSRSIGAQFGVIQVAMYGHTYEVTTFRSDCEYQDGRHPVSVTFSGPEQDARRRDFTINGLFFDPVTGRLIDYVHGRKDIRNRRIRTIGDPTERFTEDKLRMLRAIRLACELGFTIMPDTWTAIQKLSPDILQVSWERIRDELIRIFAGPNPVSGLDLLCGSGLLIHILPEVQKMSAVPDVFAHTRATMALLHNPSMIMAFASLLHETGNPLLSGAGSPESGRIAEQICRRLKMSNDETTRISHLIGTLSDFEEVQSIRESALKRFLRQPHFSDLLELYRLHCVSGNGELKTYEYCRRKLREFGLQLQAPPLVRGEDLIDMGYSPGPVFSEILRKIEDLQLEGIIRTREEALAYIQTPSLIEKDTSKSEV